MLNPHERESLDRLAHQFDPSNLKVGDGQIELEYRTETDAARLFVRLCGDRIRYCARLGGWHVWDERRWKRDEEGTVFRLAEELTPLIARVAGSLEGHDDPVKVLKFAVSLRGRRRLENVVAIAARQPGVVIPDPERFDADPWLLNVENGTIDLKSGTLRPHNRNDLITKIVPIVYDADASCERWRGFLMEIFQENTDQCDFIWRAIGYSLSGINTEHCFNVLYGIGANGKSTMVDIIVRLLGDYAATSAPDTFLNRRAGAPTNDLARLRGIRLVSAIETGERQSLAENFVKAATGGDRISARHLYAEYFEFEPVFKLWLATNHKPVIKGIDEGIWRRVRLVPFLERFEKGRADDHLRDKLIAELPGILAWAVRGCRLWQECGLQPPPSVVAATADYRSEMDTFAGFIDERCEVDPKHTATSAELYNAYSVWCDVNNERRLSKTQFGTHLGDRGFTRERTGRRRKWAGIRLAPSLDAASHETVSEPDPQSEYEAELDEPIEP